MSFNYGAAIVYFAINNNVTWDDQFQFGHSSDTSWNLNNKSFIMDIKAMDIDATPLLSLSSTLGHFVVDDPIARVMHMNVDDHTIRAALPAGATYQYDLIMIDPAFNNSRDALMSGTIQVRQGVTIED